MKKVRWYICIYRINCICFHFSDDADFAVHVLVDFFIQFSIECSFPNDNYSHLSPVLLWCFFAHQHTAYANSSYIKLKMKKTTIERWKKHFYATQTIVCCVHLIICFAHFFCFHLFMRRRLLYVCVALKR